VTDQAEEEHVAVLLRMPARDYEAIKQAAERSCRSTNKEALFRLRQSLAADASTAA
jgi:hypothetical protein